MLWLRLISDVCAALHYGISRWGSNSHRGWSHDRARIPGSWDDLAPAGRWGPGSNDRSRDLGSRWDRPSHWNWLLSSWDICSHFSAIVPLARQGTEDRRARYAPQREGTPSIRTFKVGNSKELRITPPANACLRNLAWCILRTTHRGTISRENRFPQKSLK